MLCSAKTSSRNAAVRPTSSSRAQVSAGTVEDQVGRVRELAAAGVSEVIVSLPDLGRQGTEAVERFGRVIAAVGG